MTFKDEHQPSSGPKLALSVLTLAGLGYAIWLLNPLAQTGDLHAWFIIICSLIFYARLVISVFFFIKRKVSWFEGTFVGIFYGIVVAMFVF